jgi:hypothetical protein
MGDTMNNTLLHDVGAFAMPGVAELKLDAPAIAPTAPDAPVGYRWVSKRWRVLPNGKRDYAAFHGKTAFSTLLPVSSKLRASKS